MRKLLFAITISLFLISCATSGIRVNEGFLRSGSLGAIEKEQAQEVQQAPQQQPKVQAQEVRAQPQVPEEVKPQAQSRQRQQSKQKTQPKSQRAQKRSVNRSLRYLMVPANGIANIDAQKLTNEIYSISELFNVDLVVILAPPSRLSAIDSENNQLAMRYGEGIRVSGLGFVFSSDINYTKERAGVVKFDDFDIVLHLATSDTIDETRIDRGSGEKSIFDWEHSLSTKPAIVFASPHEASYFDKVVMGVNPSGKNALSFTKTLSDMGFNDLYNSMRYTSSIGFAKPGYTYISPKRQDRIDFVYAKDVVPVSISTLELMSLADTNKVKRKAILGEVVL